MCVYEIQHLTSCKKATLYLHEDTKAQTIHEESKFIATFGHVCKCMPILNSITWKFRTYNFICRELLDHAGEAQMCVVNMIDLKAETEIILSVCMSLGV